MYVYKKTVTHTFCLMFECFIEITFNYYRHRYCLTIDFVNFS